MGVAESWNLHESEAADAVNADISSSVNTAVLVVAAVVTAVANLIVAESAFGFVVEGLVDSFEKLFSRIDFGSVSVAYFEKVGGCLDSWIAAVVGECQLAKHETTDLVYFVVAAARWIVVSVGCAAAVGGVSLNLAGVA